uniref:UBC core domain-containing protein n=1 Tax=Vombatus ursinus TaxID=29139 RepID=A0A4X2L9W0_VOMUR
MASQNRDLAAASAAATTHKVAKPGAGAACRSVGKRLQQEFMTLMMSGDKGISAFSESDNLFKWDKWSALYDVRTILLSIQSLLAEPNIDSPLKTHAAELWTNPTAFKKYLLETYMKQVTSQEL